MPGLPLCVSSSSSPHARSIPLARPRGNANAAISMGPLSMGAARWTASGPAPRVVARMAGDATSRAGPGGRRLLNSKRPLPLGEDADLPFGGANSRAGRTNRKRATGPFHHPLPWRDSPALADRRSSSLADWKDRHAGATELRQRNRRLVKETPVAAAGAWSSRPRVGKRWCSRQASATATRYGSGGDHGATVFDPAFRETARTGK